MEKEITCLSCPLGCALKARIDQNGSFAVTGNKCPKGAEYAEAEMVNPKRTVTATCRMLSDKHPRLPVRTESPCPKEAIDEILEGIYAFTAKPPVRLGDAIFERGGVRVLAARTILE